MRLVRACGRGDHLAGVEGGDAGQLELLLVHLEALGPAGDVPLAQLAALLVLDHREHAERPVLACTMPQHNMLLQPQEIIHSNHLLQTSNGGRHSPRK